jgi:hypothetical protein
MTKSWKKFIKSIKYQYKKPNKLIENLGINTPFILLYQGGILDLVATTFNLLEDLQIGIEELIKHKKRIYELLKF